MTLEQQTSVSACKSAVDTESSPNGEINKGQLLDLCVEIYFQEGSVIDRRASINSAPDLRTWLQLRGKNSLGRKNLDCLISKLSPELSDEKLRREITRWLSLNLPS